MHVLVRFVIGTLEVVGGILGVAMIGAGVYTTRSFDLFTAVFALMYAVTILAGVALLRGHRFGGLLSLIVQAAQLPRIAAVGCMYHFTAGAALWIMMGGDGVNLSYMIGSDYLWSAVASSPSLPFGVNVVAAVALAMLLATRVPKGAEKRKKKDKRKRLAFA